MFCSALAQIPIGCEKPPMKWMNLPLIRTKNSIFKQSEHGFLLACSLGRLQFYFCKGCRYTIEYYSRTSVTRTLMARLPRLFRTRS